MYIYDISHLYSKEGVRFAGSWSRLELVLVVLEAWPGEKGKVEMVSNEPKQMHSEVILLDNFVISCFLHPPIFTKSCHGSGVSL